MDASDIWIADPDRGVATRFTDEPGANEAPSWSPDGTRIAYLWNDHSPQVVKIKSLVGDTVATLLDDDPLFKRFEGWTPDGRWITYQSDESGQFEVYVQSFPVPGGKYQVTTGGGILGSWSRDGKQIHYVLNSEPTHAFEADVQSGSEFGLGPPRMAITVPKEQRGLMLAHTGLRFLALLPAGNDASPSITVVLDGLPKASRR